MTALPRLDLALKWWPRKFAGVVMRPSVAAGLEGFLLLAALIRGHPLKSAAQDHRGRVGLAIWVENLQGDRA